MVSSSCNPTKCKTAVEQTKQNGKVGCLRQYSTCFGKFIIMIIIIKKTPTHQYCHGSYVRTLSYVHNQNRHTNKRMKSNMWRHLSLSILAIYPCRWAKSKLGYSSSKFVSYIYYSGWCDLIELGRIFRDKNVHNKRDYCMCYREQYKTKIIICQKIITLVQLTFLFPDLDYNMNS